MSSRVEIDSSDVIKLVLQFCKENGLQRTVQILQEESNVSLNTVDSIEQFLSDVNHGRWDIVLQLASTMSLRQSTIFDLYEEVVLELLELRESEVAAQMLRETAPLQKMREQQNDRFKRLERLAAKTSIPDPRELYEGMPKDKRRGAIAQALVEEVDEAPPSRLLSLIGQAVKWQTGTGMMPKTAKYDLFRGAAPDEAQLAEENVTTITTKITMQGKQHAEAVVFSPDGQFLVTGSSDGFVEVWDAVSGTLRKDLSFQQEGKFMMHSKAVLALAFSRDSELLASGDQDANIKIWRVSTGECVRRFTNVHDQAITTVCFSRETTNVLSGSFDQTLRVHGLRSGKTMKEFRGHASIVQCAVYSADGNRVISGSNDGTVKVWDSKTCECLNTMTPPPPPHINESTSTPAVSAVFLVPKSHDLIYVVTKSSTLYQMTIQGQVVKTMSTGKREGGDFIAGIVSPRGEWLYVAAEDNRMYTFAASTGKLEHLMEVHEKDAIGLAHHPNLPLVASWGLDGTIKLLKP
uniref:CTLH domain-containing protein n=1 Tax=Chromera velia CCMP2878 TaxID=1169474 RepID=A0A0G4FBY7_9ALVE|mmetsp:Transcript_3779/g.7795  ORF Transcript_3779/g.7795 Transcript_3779/m.7795 type:complete len:520 (+) Transcript_3779:205-1764(+)|eukprot:Cvel_16239.t1-p1 / transcript=Cvel_16239.t1 / gene=Cvel_16239 / organism=Chromera_velia_CCMP2878 / gene_product=WD40 repeat-containing protein SMU1, putative / transcript_product=WD40 repeat-containing protein SMU1, putative / location=Cvel_scaffold1242:7631-15465(+) / protein_length=519 / sequence_SO=supercontig / SO=protein_coding / is_pseudo=false